MKDDALLMDTEEVFNGDEWLGVFVVNNSRDKERQEIENAVEDFLKSGGKIETYDIGAKAQDSSVFNNRIVSTAMMAQDSPYGKNAHDDRYVKRVYGGDFAVVEKIKQLYPLDLGLSDMLDRLGGNGKPMSGSRFKRILKQYLKDHPITKKFVFKESSEERVRQRDDMVERLAKEIFETGSNAGQSWAYIKEKTGYSLTSIRKSLKRRKLSCPNSYKLTGEVE